MMKRKQNKLHWPYFGSVVVDGSNGVRVIGEFFMLGKSNDAYNAVMQTILEFSPNRSQDDTYVIAGDCALKENCLEELNLSNAKLLWDRYHLINDVWKLGLGRSYPKVVKLLQEMIDTISEDHYNQSYAELLHNLRNIPSKTEYAKKIHANRKLFARNLTMHFMEEW